MTEHEASLFSFENFGAEAISKFGQFLVGPHMFGQIQTIVELVENTELKGQDKKRRVINELQETGSEIAEWLFKFAIEVAVGWLQAKVAEALED